MSINYNKILNTMVLSELDINQFKQKITTSFLSIEEVDFMYLAGSFVRGEIHQESDLDLFVSIPRYEHISSEEKFQLVSKIISSIDIDPDIDIDVKVFQTLRLDIQLDIFQEGVCIFERSERNRLAYIEKIMKVGYDFKIWLNRYLTMALEEE